MIDDAVVSRPSVRAPRATRRHRIRFQSIALRLVLSYLPLAILIIFVLLPFLWVFLCLFKSHQALMGNQGQTLWIKDPTLSNYTSLFNEYPFARYFLNSTIVATGTTLIAVSFSAFAGYICLVVSDSPALPGRNRDSHDADAAPGRDSDRAVHPVQDLRTPEQLWGPDCWVQRLRDSVLHLDVARFLRFHLDRAPRSGSVLLDGCNRYTSFFYVALPLTTPGLIATGIFSFILCWSEFSFALTIVNDTNMFTLTIGLAAMRTISVIDWGVLNAGLSSRRYRSPSSLRSSKNI